MASNLAVLVLAASEGAGRGDNPSGPGNVVIILGIVLGVALLGFVAFRVITARATASREQDPTRQGEHPPA